jgi:hypothetical protein
MDGHVEVPGSRRSLSLKFEIADAIRNRAQVRPHRFAHRRLLVPIILRLEVDRIIKRADTKPPHRLDAKSEARRWRALVSASMGSFRAFRFRLSSPKLVYLFLGVGRAAGRKAARRSPTHRCTALTPAAQGCPANNVAWDRRDGPAIRFLDVGLHGLRTTM